MTVEVERVHLSYLGVDDARRARKVSKSTSFLRGNSVLTIKNTSMLIPADPTSIIVHTYRTMLRDRHQLNVSARMIDLHRI